MARKREVMAIEFKPAKGGIASETHFREHRSGQGGGPLMGHESEMGVHPDMASATAHLEKHMGHCFGGAESHAKEEE
jgi:hypothetical protein